MRRRYSTRPNDAATTLGDLWSIVALMVMAVATFGSGIVSDALDLPRSGAEATNEEPAIVLELRASGTLHMAERAIDPTSLVTALRERVSDGSTVWLAADTAAPVGPLLTTYAVLEDAGFNPKMVFESEARHEPAR